MYITCVTSDKRPLDLPKQITDVRILLGYTFHISIRGINIWQSQPPLLRLPTGATAAPFSAHIPLPINRRDSLLSARISLS